MPDMSWRWVMVAAGGLMGCMVIGSLFSLPVFLMPIAKDTGWSVTGISAAMTVGFLAMAFGNMASGLLSDRIGPRPVVLGGAVLLGTSLFLASLAPSLLLFQFLFGFSTGLAAAAIVTPMMATVTGWFDTHRALAVSLVSAGFGMAPMVVSPFAAWLVTQYDWRVSLEIIALLAAAVTIPLAFLVRRPPQLEAAAPLRGEAVAKTVAEPGMTLRDVVRTPQFLILLLTNFFCCATHSGPIFHTVSYAVTCGIPMMAAVTIYSIEGLAGMGGRVAFGLLGDRFGARSVLVFGLLAQAFGALGYVFAGGLAGFYAAAAIFGFIYAGIMPLYAVLARENFPLRHMGAVIGGMSMAGSLGMALGPVAGGLIYDSMATYTWLYVGSFAIGLGAVGIALLFRPMPEGRRDGIPAAV